MKTALPALTAPVTGPPEDPTGFPAGYFEEMYRRNPDPWNFSDSPYEAAKYAATLAALPRPRYARALELGCSIGVLTARLALRCDRLCAIDASPTAVDTARHRCAHLPHVRCVHGVLPADFPAGPFDLVVVSEIGYYFTPADLRGLEELAAGRLTAGGHLLLVHWTPRIEGCALTGDQVHEVFLTGAADGPAPLSGERWSQRHHRREPTYRLDLLERTTR